MLQFRTGQLIHMQWKFGERTLFAGVSRGGNLGENGAGDPANGDFVRSPERIEFMSAVVNCGVQKIRVIYATNSSR